MTTNQSLLTRLLNTILKLCAKLSSAAAVSRPYRAIILSTSKKYDLDPQIVASLILQESSGVRWKRRYEDGFYQMYVRGKGRDDLIGHVPHTISLATEKRDRAYSYGLMQVMGQVAREFGFGEDDFTILLQPSVNIEYGCRVFAKYLEQKQGMLEPALLRYNGGANRDYPKEVLKKYNKREWERLI